MALAPVVIRVGPAGSGKTHDALKRCGSNCWMVVPSESAAESLDRALGNAGQVFTFRSLAYKITNIDRHLMASPALRAFFLREAVRQSVAPGSYFAAASPRPGFAPAVGDLVREFKQAGVTAGLFRDTALRCAPQVDDPLFAAKCASVADIWEAYDRLLEEHQTFDADDLLQKAIEAAKEWQTTPDEIVVDAFTAFTKQQITLLGNLRHPGVRLVLCLTADQTRPVLFARTERTVEELSASLAPVTVCWEKERARHLGTGPLRHLEQNVFAETVGGPVAGVDGPPNPPVGGGAGGAVPRSPCDESIRIFEAPDPVMEAEMVARAIHHLIAAGTPAERIAVVQRRLDGSATLLRSTFARYGIPIAYHAGQPLGENPLVSVVATLLRLFCQDWPRTELLRCARSSYFQIPPDQQARADLMGVPEASRSGLLPEDADLLERRAISRGLRGGQRQWFGLFRPQERQNNPAFAWLRELERWHLRLDRTDTPMVLGKLFIQMAGDLGLTSKAKQGEPLLVQEDEHAWDSAGSLLREIARVEDLANAGSVRFPDFAEAVAASWNAGLYDLPLEYEGHVQIVEAFDARQMEFDVVFLMGLNERVFPRVVADNPFLRDDERRVLAGFGVELPSQVELADEERLLFYRVVTAPCRQLVLTYARTLADGRQALPSYYVEEVRDLFERDGPPTVVRTLADVVPAPEEAVGTRERMLCAGAALAGHQEYPPEQQEALLAGLAAESPELFGDLKGFLFPRPVYELRSGRLRREVQRAVSRRAFSVSELENFIACPHQHFFAHQLRIREITEEAGAAEVGSLLHAVLREFFCRCRQEAGAGALLPPDAPALLAAVLEELLPQIIVDPRPSRVQMIRYAAGQYLERFLERETGYQEKTGLVPTYFELGFGPQAQRQNETLDAASRPDPVVIAGPDGDITLAGKIDRVDLTREGMAAVVTDYKLSRVSSLKEMLDGTSLQMPVYLLAMEQVFGIPAAAAIYHPLRKGDPHWLHRPGVAPGLAPCGRGDGMPPPRYLEVMQVAQDAIRATAAGIRAGQSQPTPGPTCEYCGFVDACRPEDAR